MTTSIKRTSAAIPVLLSSAAIAIAGCASSSSATTQAGSYKATPTPTSKVAATAPVTAAVTPARSTSAIVALAKSKFGPILVDGRGRSLYLWQGDTGSSSKCTGACASAWPPLTTQGKPQARAGVAAAKLGITKRGNGAEQVTYHGHPLYYFAGDSGPGQTNGEGVEAFGAQWDLVSAAGASASAKSAGSTTSKSAGSTTSTTGSGTTSTTGSGTTSTTGSGW
jgi:predicted lipoprotein with Yx(FWY)xxD motif